VRSTIHTTKRKFIEAVQEGKTEEAEKLYGDAAKLLDAAAGKGVYHRNTADRKKSRLHKMLNELVQERAAE
jgi:small subunit ribosomal protein S20